MIEAVIFDVDGTLVDSVDLHASSLRRAFLEVSGKDIPHGEIRAQIGKGMDHLLPVFFSGEEISRFGEEIGERKSALFMESCLPQVEAFPKVRELFGRILADGKRIALASSASPEELRELKKRAGIGDLIDGETSSGDAERSKPEPDIFEAALKELGHPVPERVICVGDTPYDIEAAAKAGMRAIALRCGGFPEETLKAAAAVYDDPAHLLGGYENSPLG